MCDEGARDPTADIAVIEGPLLGEKKKGDDGHGQQYRPSRPAGELFTGGTSVCSRCCAVLPRTWHYQNAYGVCLLPRGYSQRPRHTRSLCGEVVRLYPLRHEVLHEQRPNLLDNDDYPRKRA